VKTVSEKLLNYALTVACIAITAVSGVQLVQTLRPRAAVSAPAGGSAPDEAVNDLDIDVPEAPSRGAATARFAVVEFSDFQCPFCGNYARDTYTEIQKDFVDTGKIKYMFVDFPLERIHPFALKAGEAARCAGRQGKYWQMHDVLFRNQTALDSLSLAKHANAIGLDSSAFSTCLGGMESETVQRGLSLGKKVGVMSTPTFFIGELRSSGKLSLMRKISGAQPYVNFRSALVKVIAKSS